MGRYLYNNEKKLVNVHTNHEHYNKIGYDSTLFPKVIRKSSDTIIIAKSTDRLDLMAHKYYRDRTLWWVIALANNLPGDSFFIEPGTQIFIPRDVTRITNEMRILNVREK